MPFYVLNRNYTHRSLLGHTVQFEKGQPAFVPPDIESEVVSIGGERVDGETPSPLEPEKPAVRQLTDSERKDEIYTAFDLIAEKNDSKEFTAQGVPTVKAVERVVGFDVERFELIELWREYRVAKAEAAQ